MNYILLKFFVFLSCTVSAICFAMDLDDYQDRTILVIIDAQPIFEAAQDQRLLKTISQEISKAIEKRQKIFFVEYSLIPKRDYRYAWYGKKQYKIPTEKQLTDICQKVSYSYLTITKDSQDGSKNIIDKLTDIKKPMKIKICGVNTSLCVFDTVKGLAAGLDPSTKIVVLQDACGDINQASHKESLEILSSSNSDGNGAKIKIK